MTRIRLHEDEIEIDVDLVRALVATQFPEWAGERLTPVASSGTVNALYRLGRNTGVRLPLAVWGAEAIEREHEWIPRLTPLLPVDVPDLLGPGATRVGIPCPWSVFGWLEGSHPEPDRLRDPYLLPTDLAALVRAFHDIDLPNPPAAYRGPVTEMVDAVRQCIAEVTDEFDPSRLTEVRPDGCMERPACGSPTIVPGCRRPGPRNLASWPWLGAGASRHRSPLLPGDQSGHDTSGATCVVSRAGRSAGSMTTVR